MEESDLKIIKKIHKLFREKNLKLSICESCTAGFASHLITTLPGASKFFDSGIVCYSADSKKILLGIKQSFLEKYGTISEEAARLMSESMLKKSNADFSLAITGNLGPRPIEGKKTGLVFFSVSFEKGTESKGMIFNGSRNEIKMKASIAALDFLSEVVALWA